MRTWGLVLDEDATGSFVHCWAVWRLCGVMAVCVG